MSSFKELREENDSANGLIHKNGFTPDYDRNKGTIVGLQVGSVPVPVANSSKAHRLLQDESLKPST
jgi:hypothetical protein